MTEILHDTVRTVKNCVNIPLNSYEWRLSEDLEDRNPLASDNWCYVESEFEPDLDSSTPMVKQIEMHIRDVGMERRLNWNKEDDEYIMQ